jgi:hypothetical protein
MAGIITGIGAITTFRRLVSTRRRVWGQGGSQGDTPPRYLISGYTITPNGRMIGVPVAVAVTAPEFVAEAEAD